MAIESFAVNTLILPMQEAFQNNGMYLAYGLVYNLLSNSIPVKWAINPAKAYNGTDFTASTQNIVTLTNYISQAYTGGPYVIDSAYYATALPIINAWQTANPNTTVHRAISPFSADIAATMNQKPRIAVESKDAGKDFNYLNAAKIPDSLGNTWSNSSPGVFDSSAIGLGAFFDNNTDPCKQLAYDIFLAPNSDASTWQNVATKGQLDLFLRIGGMLHANNNSIENIENFAGPFLTTGGFTAFANQGTDNSFVVDQPSYPSAQAVPTSGKVQKLPSGSDRTWLHTSVTYRPTTQVLAHFTENSLQYDFMIGGAYKGGTGAGKIIYEGGQDYNTGMPYSNQEEAPYIRFLLDSIFFSVSKPRIVLTTTPKNIPANSPTIVTFTLSNKGGSPASGLAASVTLAPWVIYNLGSATVPPTSIVGQTLTWDSAALAAHQGPGSILTFTAQLTPPGPGLQSTTTYNATFADSFNENYTLDYCVSINALPGASPNLDKSPATQSNTPNSTVTWTITASNNGTLSLDNVVITDTLPAGLTYVSSVPAPTSYFPGPGGNSIITWQAPQVPTSILPGGSIIITLTATAPPAISAIYQNNVNLTGTDTIPSQYSINDSATLQVNNRPPIVNVVSPNGGELICQGTNIEWTSIDPDGDTLTFTIQYSMDGGASYTTIASGIPGSCPPPGPPYCSFFWDTSSLPSGSYLVKVIATDGELTGEDVSNGTFTIDNTSPTVSWVNPINGSLLNTTPVALQASATDNVSVTQVEFLYSTDGITFTSIGIDNTPSGNIYDTNWELTGLPQDSYVLRALATDQCGRTSQTNITVTVNLPPEVTLTSPKGGEVICPNGTNITWESSDPNGDILTFSLYYSSDGGFTYTLIASGLPGLCPCSYAWDTSSLPSGNNYKIRLVASDGMTSVEDVSAAPFTIDNTPPTVTWVSPLNGALIISSPTMLRVSATDNVGVNGVLFQYSGDGGLTYKNIGTDTTPVGSIYEVPWNFSMLPGGSYRLRAIATDTCNPSNSATITVTADLPPSVTVLSPNGGEIICPNGTTITWDSSDPTNDSLTYTLEYSADGGFSFTQIANGVIGNSFLWDTSGLSSGNNYLIKIIVSDGILTAFDESNTPFTIDNTPPTINWISPANGDTVTNSPVTLQASSTDNISLTNVKFKYSADGGLNFIDIATDTVPTGNIFSVSWSFSSLTGGNYLLKAIATDQCNLTNEETISITADLPPAVSLLSPNGQEIICPEGINIIWNASDPNGDPLTYSLLYSADGGLSYSLIVTDLTGICTPVNCSYHWDTSNLPSGNNYKVKIIATDGILAVEDVSIAPCTIDNTPPIVTFLTPLDNSFVIGTTTITVDASDNIRIKSVTFEYSVDGVNYNLIGTINPALRSIYALTWNTTFFTDGEYLLRATVIDQCNLKNQDEIMITIDNTPPTIQIPTPANGSSVRGEVPILITAQDNVCLSRVEFYIDGTLHHTEIATGRTTTLEFSYDWDTSDVQEGSHELKAVATDCAGFIVETINIVIVDNLPEHYVQVLVDGNLVIPPEKPDVDTIINFDIKAKVDDIDIFNTIDGTKITLHGFAKIMITYTSTDPEQIENYVEFKVPFNAMIIYPGLPINAKIRTVIFVEYKQCRILDPRTIKKDIVLFIGIKEC